VHRRQWQPAAGLALRQVEQRQDSARLQAGWVFGDVRLRPLAVLRGELEMLRLDDRRPFCRVDRSISPNTMSIEPMIATRSASMWPFDMNSVACRKAKPGARILQR